MRKVPEVGVHFWIVKVLTTGMGEATSDYLVHTIDPYVAVGIGGVAFALALALQLFVRRYLAPVYWLAVVMVAVFGTMAADAVHFLGIPYLVSTLAYLLSLATIFILWRLSEGTLSIHSIVTISREIFYWAAVAATFAMGTAAGDLAAYTLHLGWLGSGVVFTVAILVPALAWRLVHINAVLAFWVAYVLTRPLGASYADWLGVPPDLGGLGLGRGTVSLALTAVIVCYVAYLTWSRADENTETGVPVD